MNRARSDVMVRSNVLKNSAYTTPKKQSKLPFSFKTAVEEIEQEIMDLRVQVSR
jgi:hypothetical protein